MHDKMDWGRLQGLIDELGGESGLSTLIEILGRQSAGRNLHQSKV